VGATAGKVKASSDQQAEAMASGLERTVEYITRLSRNALTSGAKRDDASADEDEDCYLNIAVSDGEHSVACRFTTASTEPSSLYVHTGRRYVCEGGLCRMVSPEKGHGAVIVSSEPLSDDPGWQKIPRNHMVVVGQDRTCEIRAMSVA
jgi:predicted glutamine amidotransferase